MESNPSGNVSYTIASNHVSTTVSYLPSYVSRNWSVSAVSTGVGDQHDAYKSD